MADPDRQAHVDELKVSSPYLDVLEKQRAALVAALTPVVTADVIAAAQRMAARLSVTLDASPLDSATAAAVDRGELGEPSRGAGERNGAGWAAALRLDGMPTVEIAALEYRGVRAAQAEESDMASRFFDEPLATLERAQRLVASGLLADERLGTLRRTSRAVHDGAQGKVIFHAPPPGQLPDLLTQLDRWIRSASGRQPPLVIAGFVHARLLQWRPFEAGNGRVARIASRVALRATGGDPWGLAVPERSWAAAPLRYAVEIAATIRRRSDLRPWNELAGEAVVDSLERSARASHMLPGDVDARVLHAGTSLGAGDMVTVPELAAATGLDRAAALRQCNRLCWTGLLRREFGSRGLRYQRKDADVSDRAGNS